MSLTSYGDDFVLTLRKSSSVRPPLVSSLFVAALMYISVSSFPHARSFYSWRTSSSNTPPYYRRAYLADEAGCAVAHSVAYFQGSSSMVPMDAVICVKRPRHEVICYHSLSTYQSRCREARCIRCHPSSTCVVSRILSNVDDVFLVPFRLPTCGTLDPVLRRSLPSFPCLSMQFRPRRLQYPSVVQCLNLAFLAFWWLRRGTA